MDKIALRKINPSDKKYFAKWWIDKELIKLTSGILRTVSDKKVEKYFSMMLASKRDHYFIILVKEKVVGHISLMKRARNWYETQIVIGEKNYWNKGIGTRVIQSLLKKAKRLGIGKIYLEVRPANVRAIRAYGKCGFIATRIKKYPRNKYLPETLRMELIFC
ncbi:MAG: hypothetical protein COU98_01105 [Candidatus Staskawiczbacteria bacterium CG10_big_fil_rev_8_21_14_0_10_38_10]|uniref:N-acetyltransferase domain-containing protein n=1 Tax=Candidatus Staskawiczbacteria bacterium CG10_big_fil_rev_8_21_14_0_10_38_10 TaxID=1974891 RepID=A0A2H9T1L0_9BACT|nr:MAG: hypothetical protein COU98_01105 [Candidatus Staskawiczbacteria bacterium CG10_big_fil_rev_8_21_14_0_10_38_10]